MGEEIELEKISARELQSLRMKLRRGEGHALMTTAEKLAQLESFPADWVADLVSAVSRDQCISTLQLTPIIERCKSPDLFKAVEGLRSFALIQKSQIFARHYFEDVEEQLCDAVYKTAGLEAPNQSGFFIEALEKNGRHNALETLEALEYDLDPSAKSAMAAENAIKGAAGSGGVDFDTFMQGQIYGLKSGRFAAIRKAIATLRERLSDEDQSLAGQNTPPKDLYVSKALGRSRDRREEAMRSILLKMNDTAAWQYRKAAEALLKAACVLCDCGKPSNKPSIEDLKGPLKSKKAIPISILTSVNTIQEVTNFPSHDQEEELVTSEAKLATIVECLDGIEKWVRQLMDGASAT